MSASQRGNRVMIADRTAMTLPGGSTRRFAAGLGLLVALAVLIATLGAVNASAYECYSGNTTCSALGPVQHLNPGERQAATVLGHGVREQGE